MISYPIYILLEDYNEYKKGDYILIKKYNTDRHFYISSSSDGSFNFQRFVRVNKLIIKEIKLISRFFGFYELGGADFEKEKVI